MNLYSLQKSNASPLFKINSSETTDCVLKPIGDFMKKLSLAVIMIAASSLTNAASIQDVVGSYKITSKDIPVMNIVTVDAKGNVKLTEQSPYGTLECKGKGTIKNDILESKVKCDNGSDFTQRINLKNVKNFAKFKAPVYSSLYDQELEMTFERL